MTPTARRTTARRRRLAAAVALGLLAPLPILATTTTSASAVTKSTVVTFDRCDVRTTANDPSSRVGPVFTWKPTMTFDLSTPVRIKENVTGRVTLSDFPASKIPVSIPKHSNTYYTGYLESSLGGTFDYGKSVAAPHVLGQPMPLGESEQDFWFTKPGLVNLFASEFSMNVEGYDGPNNTGTWRRYYVKCDKPVTPTVVASVPTWDPAAKAAVALSAPSVVQGRTLRVERHRLPPGRVGRGLDRRQEGHGQGDVADRRDVAHLDGSGVHRARARTACSWCRTSRPSPSRARSS